MKKKSFSLVEIIVCLGLLSLLLSALFSWYHTFSKQKGEFKKLKAPLMEERYAHQRLQHIFLMVETPLFSTENGDLVFIFDRGLCRLPELSGKVLGRLYHDPSCHSLCLTVWPHPTPQQALQEPSQTFVLIDGIESCAFTFYHPPNPFKKPVDPPAINRSMPQEGWQNQWKIGYNRVPALIKIIMKREDKKGIVHHMIEYVFDLPVPIAYTIYQK